VTWKWKGGLVRQEMVRRGWNQAELAQRAGVTPNAISRLVRGGSVSIVQVRKVAEVLGRTPEDYWDHDGADAEIAQEPA